MRIVIVGDGKVGRTLAEHLSKENHNIVIIDQNSRVVEESINSLDIMGVTGNGASYEVQKEAGVDKSDLLIAVTSSDEINILCCLVAKKLGARATIARVRNPDYSRQLSFLRDELGLSLVINPELAAANEISRILRFPSALKVDTFSRGRSEIVELKVTNNNRLADTALNEIEKKYRLGILVCAVQRGKDVHIPKGDFILRVGDRIYITGDLAAISSFVKTFDMVKEKVRSVMIIGGGKITYYLSKMLEQTGMRVKIIEKDENRCLELSESLRNTLVINGDGTDQELLGEEGMEETDALVALTGIDEENIIIAMYANTKNVGKVIAKVNRTNYMGLLGSVGVESIISPKDITANYIIRFVRAMENSAGSNVTTLHRIVEDKAEALEFQVRKNSGCIGRKLRDLNLKPNLLIACIIHDNKVIIPHGDDVINEGDSVIVVTTNRFLGDLDDILQTG
jgi:trk system potassium uptake protein TrkA